MNVPASSRMPCMFQRGLTMVEVLVALAVTAIALLAAHQAMGSMTQAASRQQQVLWAQLCADNALTMLRLGGRYPAVGQMEHGCSQQGQDFQVRLFVSATANPSFRRVQAKVFQGDVPVLSVSTVAGRY